MRPAAPIPLLVALLLGVASCGGRETAPGSVTPTGFGRVEATVTASDGSARTFCLWLADDSVERAQGLQGVTGLGDCPGMAFVYDEPVDHRFWMKDTLLPLTITFWDAAGSLVSSADMAPCPSTAVDCPRTAPGGPYLVAVEVAQGEAGGLGLVPGSRLVLGAVDPVADDRIGDD